jgi:hypothetical protein
VVAVVVVVVVIIIIIIGKTALPWATASLKIF